MGWTAAGPAGSSLPVELQHAAGDGHASGHLEGHAADEVHAVPCVRVEGRVVQLLSKVELLLGGAGGDGSGPAEHHTGEHTHTLTTREWRRHFHAVSEGPAHTFFWGLFWVLTLFSCWNLQRGLSWNAHKGFGGGEGHKHILYDIFVLLHRVITRVSCWRDRLLETLVFESPHNF